MNDDRELDLIYKEYEELVNSVRADELRAHPQLYHVAIEATQKCNAHCEHCSISCDAQAKTEELKTEELKKVFRDIAERYDPKKVSVGFTGGEPLVRPDLIELAEYARDLGFSMSLTTNGALLTNKMIDKLYNANVRNIAISIDGLQETHENFRKLPGCYPKLLKSLRKMLEYEGNCVGVTTVVSKKNISELEELYKQFADIGIHYWRVFGIDPEGRALDAKDIYLDRKDYEYMFDFMERKNNEGKMSITYACSHFIGFEREKQIRGAGCFMCQAGLGIASVLSNGDIFGCSNIPRLPELIQGNVKTDNFVDVWENKFEAFRNPDKLISKKCKECKYWRYCRGDAMHTYDFKNKEQLVCMKDILGFE